MIADRGPAGAKVRIGNPWPNFSKYIVAPWCVILGMLVSFPRGEWPQHSALRSCDVSERYVDAALSRREVRQLVLADGGRSEWVATAPARPHHARRIQSRR